jgi:hypothetical protein
VTSPLDCISLTIGRLGFNRRIPARRQGTRSDATSLQKDLGLPNRDTNEGNQRVSFQCDSLSIVRAGPGVLLPAIAGTSGASYEREHRRTSLLCGPATGFTSSICLKISARSHGAAIVTEIERKIDMEIHVNMDRTESTVAAWSRL